eukprot:TRINITY_DN94166_c0_g1_i1.p1 TRINITY_DN94166_c0_g1~~TRINITY_DN94166_c0_g1_i1.p1  ORF type:complete len:155 (+),score=38.33 TRINITY_DN94166_c0_g1_i1:76-540(+)
MSATWLFFVATLLNVMCAAGAGHRIPTARSIRFRSPHQHGAKERRRNLRLDDVALPSQHSSRIDSLQQPLHHHHAEHHFHQLQQAGKDVFHDQQNQLLAKIRKARTSKAAHQQRMQQEEQELAAQDSQLAQKVKTMQLLANTRLQHRIKRWKQP